MNDETAAQPSIGLTVVEAVCLVAAGLVYFVSLGVISGLGSHVGGDPATEGLDEFFAGIVIFLLWLPLAAFVSLACRVRRQCARRRSRAGSATRPGSYAARWSADAARSRRLPRRGR